MKMNELKEGDIIHIEPKKTYENYHPYLGEFDAKVKSVVDEKITIYSPVARATKDWTITKDDVISLALVKEDGNYQEIIFD